MASRSIQFVDDRVHIERFQPQATIVHHVDEQGTWATRGRTLLLSDSDAQTWKTMGQFPWVWPRDAVSFFRLGQRFARADKCLVLPVESGVLGIRAGNVYRIAEGEVQPIGNIQGHCPLHRSATVAGSGAVYFGEYFGNRQRGAVRIYRVSEQLDAMDIAYTFVAGQIRHVHGVYRDPFVDGRLWVTTGDYAGENYLLFTDDEFQTVERLGDGSQMWRAVGLLFTAEKVAWITDSHLQQNYAITLDRGSLQIEKHQAFPGPVWYSATTSDGLFLAGTTVERGPGAQEKVASVWVSRDAIEWTRILSFQKDRWPMPHFKFGTLSFPSGTYSSKQIWISGEAVRPIDGTSLLVRVEP